MLPSMPLLMTPVRELVDDTSSSSDDSPTHNSSENGHTECHMNSSYSVLSLSNSLHSSTNGIASSQEVDKIREKSHSPEKRTLSEPTSAQKKKKKNQHRKMLTALTPDSVASRDISAQNFAEAYFQKVRNRLDDEKWAQFVQELISFEEKTEAERKPVDLFHRMEIVLRPHSDLVDEFLGFLLPHQALEVNRIMAYLSLEKMSEFFRKLNILLMKRQVRQVYSTLESLITKPNVSLSNVKEAILPLLKSSSLLSNLFLELLPGERPPDSLMTDFEQVDVKEDSEFETVVVPDCPDPYGSENCVCHCHLDQTRHCIACGIKYLNGRVYVQHGKSLRPAKVIYKDKKHLDLLKWEEEKSRNRRRWMPKTMSSPGSLVEHRPNADSEDDCVKKSPRTPRIRVTRPKICKKHPSESENKEEEVLEGIFPLTEAKNADDHSDELVESVIKRDGMDEHDFDEIVLENECNTEEDEEEYLNKEVHSENESSIEAEDIGKELECSFEDEEVDDFENSEIEMSENIAEYKDDEPLKMSSEGSSSSHRDCVGKSSLIGNSEEKTSHNSKQTLPKSPVINQPNTVDDMKIEPLSVSFTCEDDEIKSEVPDEMLVSDTCESNFDLKREVEVVDVRSGSRADGVGCDIPSVSGSNHVDIVSKEWTREEDKIILQTFQHENGLEQTFETASLQLPNRTKEEIQGRFEVLMKLLKEMISDESNSNP